MIVTEIEIGIVTGIEIGIVIGMKDQEHHRAHHQVHLEWDQHQEQLLRALFRKDLLWIKEHLWDLEISQMQHDVCL